MTEPSSPPKSSGSAVRLLVLIGLLALAIGAWFYDYSYAWPGSEAKYEEVLKMADAKNARGVEDGGVVMSKDVSDVIGFAPTYVEEGEYHTTEWYCWWGKIPFLAKWKRYITVVYVGEPRKFSSHYKNEKPPEEALPGFIKAPSQAEVAGEGYAPPPGTGGGAAPGGAAPGGAAGAAGSSESGESASKSSEAPTEGDKPAEPKPAEEKPAEEKPAENKPADEKPAEEKPAEKPGEKPAEEKPASEAKPE